MAGILINCIASSFRRIFAGLTMEDTKVCARKSIVPYLLCNKVFFFLAVYVAAAVFIQMVPGINIFPPCLWHTLFNIRCPGCGITRAFINLIELNFAGAYRSNPLVYVLLPAGAYYLTKDFAAFCEHSQGGDGNPESTGNR